MPFSNIVWRFPPVSRILWPCTFVLVPFYSRQVPSIPTVESFHSCERSRCPTCDVAGPYTESCDRACRTFVNSGHLLSDSLPPFAFCVFRYSHIRSFAHFRLFFGPFSFSQDWKETHCWRARARFIGLLCYCSVFSCSRQTSFPVI